ncbi:hypothetical protein [Oceanobacillus salinisoli]|nr:hypothetical protein [Oceanobacillus salinisoli]
MTTSELFKKFIDKNPMLGVLITIEIWLGAYYLGTVTGEFIANITDP